MVPHDKAGLGLSRPDQIADPNYHLGTRGSGLVGAFSTPVWKLQRASHTGSGTKTSVICRHMRWLVQVTAKSGVALHALQPRMCVGVLRWPAFPGAKSAAPRKRSMVAWRRRPNPRVMQCPRQQLCLDGMKKVQRGRRNSPAETGLCGGRICLRGRGWSSRFSPPSATSPRSPMRRGRLAMAPPLLLPASVADAQPRAFTQAPHSRPWCDRPGAPIPGAWIWLPRRRHVGPGTARPAGPAAAAARAPACG